MNYVQYKIAQTMSGAFPSDYLKGVVEPTPGAVPVADMTLCMRSL